MVTRVAVAYQIAEPPGWLAGVCWSGGWAPGIRPTIYPATWVRAAGRRREIARPNKGLQDNGPSGVAAQGKFSGPRAPSGWRVRNKAAIRTPARWNQRPRARAPPEIRRRPRLIRQG